MNKDDRIYVAGHNGLVGSAIIRKLEKERYTNIIYRSSKKLDLRKQGEVDTFFREEKPDYVFLAAAKVGGIKANNDYPAEFIYDNIMIQSNLIHAACKNEVKKLLFLGSSCIYPKYADQPIKEEYLLDGKLEPTNEAYAIAKISGIKMCQYYNKQYGTRFISVMPTNLFGPNDNFDLETAHVLPSLIRKFHEAKIQNQKEVVIWGTGTPKREFLHVDDLADAVVYLMNKNINDEILNIGVGKDISINELAQLIKDIVGFEGQIINDTKKPDGTPRKLLDVSKINNIGWEAKLGLREGIEMVYNWYLKCYGVGREG